MSIHVSKYLSMLRPSVLVLSLIASSVSAQESDFPKFSVSGHDVEMAAINELHQLHHPTAFSDCTLWDPWLPHATLWTGQKRRDQYRTSFLNRKIDAEGYVSVNQHRGMAHSEGWPFPAWQQSGSAGFHFSVADEVFAIHNFAQQALTNTDGWKIDGASVEGIDPVRGLRLKATHDVITITTPAFLCGTIVAPFARMELAASGLGDASQPNIQWQFEGESEWQEDRHMLFPRQEPLATASSAKTSGLSAGAIGIPPVKRRKRAGLTRRCHPGKVTPGVCAVGPTESDWTHTITERAEQRPLNVEVQN